jgi:serine/threonine protein kinase
MTEPSAADTLSLESLMAQVADEFLERLNAGEQPSVEEFARRHPQIATFLRQMLPTLLAMRGGPPTEAPAAEAPAAEAVAGGLGEGGRLGDFRILRQVGRGGMGIVYEAVQESLGRRVALKVLPFASALDERQLHRFKTEAQAAGQLHHTSIVPVFFVGSERGVHFYAMQFIDGWPLTAVIDQLRQQGDPLPAGAGPRTAAATPPRGLLSTLPSSRSPAFFETVARWGERVAEALDHAHRQGVVHRDVKPANLMLDAQGNPWVTDFGLAQVTAETRLTLTGDLLGTLRYMSPEQALGQRDRIDRRTDVYSLGATLYELLTLRPAFDGDDRQQVLRRIAAEEPAPPRRLNRAVPAELETVVLKAMAKAPEERYATAEELAHDLRRFQENRPVLARRPSLWQRTAKWARRHRTLLTVAAVTALLAQTVTLGVLLGKNAEVGEQKREAEEARDEARTAQKKLEVALGKEQEARGKAVTEETRAKEALARIEVEQGKTRDALALAEKHFSKAQDVVDRLVMHLGERARNEPHLTAFARQMCEEALKEYQGFLDERPNDPHRAMRVAFAHFRVGSLYVVLGNLGKAETHLKNAVVMLERLRPHTKTPGVLLSVQAMAHEDLSKLQLRRLDRAALREGKAAIDRQIEALRADGKNPDYRRRLAGHYMVLVNAQSLFKEELGARTNAALGSQLYRDLAEEFPNDALHQVDLARGLSLVGVLQMEDREYTAAAATLREAIAAADRAAKLDGKVLLLQPTRVSARAMLGGALEGLNDFTAAEKAYRDAVPDALACANAYPDSTVHVSRLSMVTSKLGKLLLRRGRAAEAKPYLQQAAFAQQIVADKDRQNAGYTWLLGLIQYDLAAAHLALGDHQATAEIAGKLVQTAARLKPNPPAPAADRGLAFLQQAGKFYVACARLAHTDARVAEAERPKVADAYQRQAVAALGLALDRGLRPATPLDQDRDLEPLWPRPDFQKLLTR